MQTSVAAPMHKSDLFLGLVFVLIWSAGYIAAAFALKGMGPFTVAALRFVGSAALISLLLLIRPAPRAGLRALSHAAIAGLLLQAGFFGFAYAGLRAGVSPAVAGLICGLMPLTTAAGAAIFLGERFHAWATLGLGLGLAGVLLVVAPDLFRTGNGHRSLWGYLWMTLALLSLSLGTLYQKRFVTTLDTRLSLLVQLTASALALLPIAIAVEGLRVTVSADAMLGLGWVILVNSAAGLLLYLVLLSRSGAGRVASLFYLVPPATAVLAALVLGAHFGLREIAGFGLAATGVWLGQRS